MPRLKQSARPTPIAVVAIAVMAALITGCAPTSSDSASSDSAATSSEPVAGGTVVYARAATVTSLDLHNQITANNAFAIDKIFEPLLAFDADGAIIPWLAEDYTVSEDALTYTFTLREGVLFSDGSALDASDVVFSLNRHLDVGGPVPLTAPISSITATDDRTVEIVLDSPFTVFIAELAGFSNGVIPEDFGGLTEEAFFEKPIGTGPFSVQEWDPDGDLVFTKNENYWQEGKPYIDSLVYRFIADGTQALQQLQAGQVQAIETVPVSNVTDLKANSSVTVVQSGSWVIEQLFFNTKNRYFSDPKVRRALAMAIDREGLTAATTFGTAEVADALVPPTITYSGQGVIEALEFDLDAAAQELAASSYPDGFDATLLIASGNALRAQEAQIIQAAAAKIGITLSIESIDLAAFRERFFAYDFDLMINSGQSTSPDPDSLVSFQADPAGFSRGYWTQYSNDEVTRLIQLGRVTPDGDEREKIYRDIQQILADEVPYVPLFYPSAIKASSSALKNLTVLPNDSIRFQDAWLEGAAAG